MSGTLITTTEEKIKPKHNSENQTIDSQDQVMGTPQLLVDISKKEKVIVIKIKKLFRKQN